MGEKIEEGKHTNQRPKARAIVPVASVGVESKPRRVKKEVVKEGEKN